MEKTEIDVTSYKSLIGMSEYFRTTQPPRLRESVHCLQACLSIDSLPNIEKAQCRLNLAKMLLRYTRNVGHARGHLEQAVSFVQPV